MLTEKDINQTKKTHRENKGNLSIKHLFKLFLFYLSILSIIAGWIIFRHSDILNPWLIAGITLILAAVSIISHWYTGRYSRVDNIVEGNIPVTEISLIVTFIFTIVGIAVTDYSPAQSYQYWGAMTIFLAIAAILIGWSRAKKLKRTVPNILVTQLVHWGTTWVAVFGVFFLLQAGRLNYENTGLILLIVLGLATFLDGYRVSWRLSLVGILMFVTSLIAAYLEQYLWVLLIATTIIAIAAYFWARHRHNHQHKLNNIESTE